MVSRSMLGEEQTHSASLDLMRQAEERYKTELLPMDTIRKDGIDREPSLARRV